MKTATRIFLLITFLVSTGRAAVFVVSNNLDSGPGSLRRAVLDANANGGGIVTFSNVLGTITLTNGEFALTQNTTIVGPGSGILAVSGNSASRIFNVSSNATVSITGLTIQNGYGYAPGGGGGIYNQGALALTNCNVVNNFARNYQGFSPGGGIYNAGALTLHECVVESNRCDQGEIFYGGQRQVGGSGGGIYNSNLLTLSHCIINNNHCGNGEVSGAGYSSGGSGGGVYNLGTMILSDSTINENSAGNGGGSQYSTWQGGFAGSGGGIWNGGTSVLIHCNVNSNLSGNGGDSSHEAYALAGADGGNGGGICSTGVLTLTNCTVSTNACGHGGSGGSDSNLSGGGGGPGGSGGGIWSSGGLFLRDCILAGNATGSGNAGGNGGTFYSPVQAGAKGGDGGAGGTGGGIFSLGNSTIQNCTISGNFTAQGGNGGSAGVGSAGNPTIPTGYGGNGGAGGGGGGIYSLGNSTIQSCTISANVTVQGGAGGLADFGGLHGTNGLPGNAGSGGGISSISNNLQIVNTIVANNASPTNFPDVAGNFLSLGFNLVGNTNGSIGFGASGDLIGVNPLLGPLADNGGPTLTMALLPGSPAIDQGSTGGTLTDQRGLSRRFDVSGIPNAADGSDIGAFEYRASFIVTDNLDSGPGSLRQAVGDANANGGGIITFSNVTGTISLTNGELLLATNISIVGPGPDLLALSGMSNRVFNVGSNATVSVTGLTIQHGSVVGNGGGISNAGNLSVGNCVFTGNSAVMSNDVSVVAGRGGAIYNQGMLTLSNCVLTANQAGLLPSSFYFYGNLYLKNGGGGGIYNDGVLAVETCLITGNIAVGGKEGMYGSIDACSGGGIFNANSATVSRTIISNNICGSGAQGFDYYPSSRGGNGGGIYNYGTLQVYQTSIIENRCGDGGIAHQYYGAAGGNGGSGGGIWNGGTSVLINCNVSGNLSGNGGDSTGPDPFGGVLDGTEGGNGGGIYNTAALSLTNCTVATNTCGRGGRAGNPSNQSYAAGREGFRGGPGGSGGGIWSSGGLLLHNCTFAGNTTGAGNAGNFGGDASSLSLIPAGKGGNGGAGGSGGGIWSSGGLLLRNCTFAGNTTGLGSLGGAGGNSYNVLPPSVGGDGGAGGSGGAIWCVGNSAIESCSISGNFTAQGGSGGSGGSVSGGTPPGTYGVAGVAGSGGGISSISNNLQILNTIVANNVTPTNFPDVAGNFLSLGFNLIGNTNGGAGFGAAGDLIGVNPLLGPLADNGGPTLTMALLPGSPAIDTGTSFGTPSTDQRGVPRPQGLAMDIGAFEFVFPPGLVKAWGLNSSGQINIPANLTTNVQAIAAGVYHSLALKTDGTVIGWGENDFGQTNPPVGLSNVTAIAAGWGTSLALKRDGTLEEWGWDGGYGLKTTAKSLTNITAIAACWDCLMALKADGSVAVWGKSTHGETNIPSGLTDVVEIAGGGFHCLALQRDGSVVAWGDNSSGETNVPAGLNNVVAVAAGAHHCLALKNDGTVVAWGNDSSGQTNVPAGLSNVVAVSGGDSHSLALKNDGTVAAWGNNSNGQTNLPANLTNVVAIAAGGFHNLALVGSGAPVLTVQPISRTITAGDAVTLISMVAGQPVLAYQWRKSGTAIVGETNSLLYISHVQTNQAGSYDVVITNSFGGVESHEVVLTVLVLPIISQQPMSQMILVGGTVSFSVASQSALPVTYQWQFNGTNLPFATNSTLTLLGVSLGQAGGYTVLVKSKAGPVQSNPALLDVRPLFASVDGNLLTGTNYTYIGPTTVSLVTGFTNGSVYYSLDGSPPSFGAHFYQSPFTMTQSGFLRAGAYSADFFQYGEMPTIAITIIPVYGINYLASPGGSISATPSNSTYAAGTVVNLQAAPKPGWTFLNWLGDCSGGNTNTTLTMDGAKIVQAVFGTTLGVTVAGNGAVTVDPASTLYPYGTVVRLTGQPAPGYAFGTWGNAAAGISANPLYFKVTNASPVVSALFTLLTPGTVSLTVQTSGRGKVQASPPGNAYSLNASVTLTAVPEPGQQFLGWSGDANGGSTNLSLTMNQSKTILGTFSHTPSLSVDAPLNGLFNSGFRLLVTSDFGAVCAVEGTTNLADWNSIETLTNTYGTMQITDPRAVTNSAKFYRLMLQ